MAFYKSKFTGEEIDQRLTQGTFDDAVKAGFIGTKEQFDQLLAKIQETTNAAEAAQPAESDKLETVNKNIVDAINEIQTEVNTKQPIGDYATRTELNDKVAEEAIARQTEDSAIRNDMVGKKTPEGGEIFNCYMPEIENKATGVYSHAEGISTIASGEFSHAEGNMAQAIGSAAHAEGYNTKAQGDSSHAEGSNTTASGRQAHSEGNSTEASGENSHAEGNDTAASGSNAHAEGYKTTASGVAAHTEGSGTKASGEASHSEGINTIASGKYSHSEGNLTEATGENSHTEGFKAKAQGEVSHSEGDTTVSNGWASHAEGFCTETSNNFEHAQGYYNKTNTGSLDANKTLHSIGFGTGFLRKNAQEVMCSGDHFILGIGNYNGYNYQDAETLQEVINTHASDIATLKSAGYQTAEQVSNTVNSKIDELVGAAPEALDTLKEIGDALNNDPDFAVTMTTELSKKVDKVEGKQLSTEDYTTAEKEKLAGLKNYDDTSLRNELQQTETGVATANSEIDKLKSSKQDILVSGENIKTINGTSILGNGDITITGGSSEVTWDSVTGKPSFATVATSGAYSDLTGTPDLSGYQTKSDDTLTTTNKTVVGAINELLAKIQELETKNTELESRLTTLEGTN